MGFGPTELISFIMQTTFTTESGKTIAPPFFAVYHKRNGETFKKIQDEISMYNFDEYEGVRRIELYKNGTENLAAEQIDRLDKE
jgi:hypothetical protein